MSEEIKDVKVEEPKKEKVVKEKEVKKEEVVKAEDPKKEVKAAVVKQFVVGAKVIDKKKKEYIIHDLPEGQLFEESDIVLNANGLLSVQPKSKLQLV